MSCDVCLFVMSGTWRQPPASVSAGSRRAQAPSLGGCLDVPVPEIETLAKKMCVFSSGKGRL